MTPMCHAVLCGWVQQQQVTVSTVMQQSPGSTLPQIQALKYQEHGHAGALQRFTYPCTVVRHRSINEGGLGDGELFSTHDHGPAVAP
jgi:hypothetical protein